jgi:hypothetical protein
MAQAMGFEAPALLTERPVSDDMLPLEEEHPASGDFADAEKEQT